jgi:transcriptional regulator with XRE-family HTH domain
MTDASRMAASRPDDMLAKFLRECRGRITVAQAGLPTRRQGRSDRLTQEDLARLTGYSVRTISALEQGANHRPSRDLLDAITAALSLTGDERRTLWQLAADMPPPEAGYASTPDSSLAVMAAMMDPHPTYVSDAVYNVECHNDAFANWVSDFSAKPAGQRNLARWLFLSDHSRHLVAHWDREAPALVARIRSVRTRLPRAPALGELIEELCDLSPEFLSLWTGAGDVAGYPTALTLTFRVPGHTDPRQPDDDGYHVPLTMCTLTPMTPDDQHRFVALLLPSAWDAPVTVNSELACTACHGPDSARLAP